ncbi:MAG: tripartite tricarboxylate transporter substrate-binding protein [Burkholderiaceae bacterium]
MPYRGVALAEVDLMAGNIDILFGNISTSARLVTDGKLRALASTGLKRSAAFPDLPTVAETLPGYEVLATWVLVAPARTPREIVELLSRELHAVQQEAELRAFLKDLHAEAMSGGPNEARAFLRDEVRKWEDLIKAANIRLE